MDTTAATTSTTVARASASGARRQAAWTAACSAWLRIAGCGTCGPASALMSGNARSPP